MQKDLQAFEQLKELASGKNRPRVQWLSLEEKKSVERKTETARCSSSNGSSGRVSSSGSSSSSIICSSSSSSSSRSSSGSSRSSSSSSGSGSSSNSGSSGKTLKSSFLQETGKKDDRILEAQTDQSLRNLSQARLRALLAAQKRLAESPLFKRLPDGGAKILKKMVQIQAALDFVVHVDALVLGLEVNMGQLHLDEKADGKQQLEVDDMFRDSVARKVQRAQRARMPYSQASLAVSMTPDGAFPGVNPKYRSGAPKFLTFAEAEELNRASRRAIALQEKEQPSAVMGSQGSAFRTAHWHQPDVDFSSEKYREPTSDFDDEEEEPAESEQEEEDEVEEEENEGDPPAFMHLRPVSLAEMLA